MPTHEKKPDALADALTLFQRTAAMVGAVESAEGLDASQLRVGFDPSANRGKFLPNAALPAVDMVAGMAGLGIGVKNMVEDPSVDAAIQIGKGTRGVVGGTAAMAGYSTPGFSAGMQVAGGILDGAQAVNDYRNGDYTGAVLNTTSTVLDFAAPELAVPWKLGNYAGKKIKTFTEGVAAERGYFGEGKTMSDHANAMGRKMEDATGSRLMGASMATNTKLMDTGYTSSRWLLEEMGIMGDDEAGVDAQPTLDAIARSGGSSKLLEAQLSLMAAADPMARAALQGVDPSGPFAHYAE